LYGLIAGCCMPGLSPMAMFESTIPICPGCLPDSRRRGGKSVFRLTKHKEQLKPYPAGG
jgi:hypothetical protein